MGRPDPILLELARRGGHACPVCSYDLAGLASDRCAECGTPLAARIVLTHPRSVPWAVILAGLMLTVGEGLFILLAEAAAFTFLSPANRPRNAVEWFAVIVYPAMLVAGSSWGVAMLLRRSGRRWFHGRGRSTTVVLAVVAGMLPLAAFALFVVLIWLST